ncbi:hypothetical protein M0804_015137 [Polistes exclamans]|nr:hypothetical protein M0804_015137 [Polistes exclamans]
MKKEDVTSVEKPGILLKSVKIAVRRDAAADHGEARHVAAAETEQEPEEDATTIKASPANMAHLYVRIGQILTVLTAFCTFKEAVISDTQQLPNTRRSTLSFQLLFKSSNTKHEINIILRINTNSDNETLTPTSMMGNKLNQDSWTVSDYTNNVVVYIGGFADKSIKAFGV